MYHQAGCWDRTLLPYAICSLKGYPGELVRSSGMDITIDDVLNILDEHYNNIKTLDVQNQELFQMCIGKKETISDWGVCLSRHLQILPASFPEHFPPDWVAKLKHDCFYSRLPKWLKKAGVLAEMYSNYLRAAREAEKEEAMEPSWNQTADKPSKPKATSFFPLQKLKRTQPTKVPAIRVVHVEEEGSKEEAGVERKDPDGIDDITEEFIVHLARAVNETQKDEKHCYHCSSTEHFICECLLVKISWSTAHLNWKKGMAMEKGAQTPQVKMAKPKVSQEGMAKA